MSRHELRFGLLGPPVLYDVQGAAAESGADGIRPADDVGVTAIGSPKVRTLLAALLLEAGRVVSVDSLKDALWGLAPPASAHASLHNHVARLRRLLDDPERLRTVPPGYVLRVEQGELDVQIFERHVAAARGAHAARNWERVVRECASALALWRGTPLDGLPSDLGGYAYVQRLAEARLLLLEWRYDAELALGGARLDRLLPELAALAAEHPLRESYHRQLMLALHRTGRRAEALAVHRDLRTRLVEELGVEPGPLVREAHVEVLRRADAGGEVAGAGVGVGASAGAGDSPGAGNGALHVDPGAGTHAGTSTDAGTDADSGTPSQAAPPPPTPAATREEDTASPPPPPAPRPAHPHPSPFPLPAQLPPPPPHFTGRSAVLDDLRGTLGAGDAPAVAVISGMPGVGKSALALHVAHELRERFPDGQLYVNLHGATPGMTPLTAAQALAALLRDLGTEPRHIPEHPDAAAALLRSLLAPTRTLMVLDDAASAAQVRPLLPAGAGCAVIVTSRSSLTVLDGARRHPLTPLTREESAALLRVVSGRDGLDAAHPLVELTGRLPLALRIVAARLAARRALTPDVLAHQLAATEGRLHHLEYDDLSVRRSLAVAHDALAASDREADRDAALVLRGIGALDLPAYGAPLLARLAGIDAHRAEAALDRLIDVALLEETAYGRYTPHDLVRAFARELAEAAEESPDASGVPSNASGTLPTAPSGPPTAAAADIALRWYAAVAELALTAIVEPGLDRDDRRRPTAVQPPDHAIELAALPPFESGEQAFAWGDMELENVVTLVERYADAAADADERLIARISCLIRLLFPYVQRSGRVAEMEVLGRTALRLARRLGDEAAEAYALGDLGGVHFLTGRQSEALALNDRALTIWRRLGRISWVRRCLNNRGLLLEGLGRYTESERALRRSLEYSRQLNDPYGEAVTHSHLGNLYEHTDPRAAIEQHRRSLVIGEEIGAVIVQHSAHCNIGYAHLTLGEPAAALPHFEESLRILGGHGDWHGESQTRLGLVRALRLLGRTERAEHECAELLRRADARADRYSGGLARHQYGLLLRERGRAEEARAEWRVALDALNGTDEQTVAAELRELLHR
ncbi:DNA-binding SARP family transcriptional activator [Streptomyces sp. SLBN-31]|nr:BTAD domain-containing putative transcriptional regulator [Streptomyces sp. SLBN-31]TQJ75506.1 DNA-binding SARP family transcriptional activator [Streptomyces sp. SLBN-31]